MRTTKAFAVGDHPIDSDERLAKEMNIPLTELVGLKNGESDPSARLVRAFVSFIGPLMLRNQVDYYLIIPFKWDTLPRQ